MRPLFLTLAAISAFLGVGMGAFGAHALKSVLSAEMLDVYKTAVSYQMWHALGLLAIASLHSQNPRSKLLIWAGWLMFTGIILFSGSLYALTLLNLKWLGVITPFGGTAFLSAWLLVTLFSLTKPALPTL
ncbi:MAG: DUF423 domain-containing protein [Methylococcaceae bacterium]|jgi:uncharacterized membrane protein YgdD (TMEM256/DUF423 family)